MSLRTYRVTVGGPTGTRELHVPSPTDVQAADAAAPLMNEGEAILSIMETSEEGRALDGPPPRSQAAELAPVTPGAAAAPEPGSSTLADETRQGLVVDGREGGIDPTPAAGQRSVFSQGEANQPAGIDGDPAELNRGLGQERVGEPGAGPDQRPLDPAAGGPGTGAGSSADPSSEDARARTAR